MNELSPEARRILGLARRGDELKDSDRARLDHRVARRLALAAGVTGTALGSAKVATGTAILSTMLGKGLVTGTLVVAAVAGGWKATEQYVSQQRTMPAVATTSALSPNFAPKQPNAKGQLAEQPNAKGQLAEQPNAKGQLAEQPSAKGQLAEQPSAKGQLAEQPSAKGQLAEQPTVQSARRLDEAAVTAQTTHHRDNGVVTAPSVSRDVAATNQPKKLQSRANNEVESGASAPEPSSGSPTDPLLAEVAALREAQKAISAGQTEQALWLVAEQDKRFAGGALAQERAAAKIFAWCNLGRVAEARVGAAAFERRWPRSPLISRVRRACDSDATE